MDGDGDLDIVVTSFSSAEVTLLTNDGTGTYSFAHSVATAVRPHGVVFGAFDAIHGLEFVTANDGSASVTMVFRIAAPATEDNVPGQDDGFHLHRPQPNPATGDVEIGFTLSRPLSVRIDVFNVVGKRVTTMAEEELPAGQFTRRWASNGMTAGSYIVRLQADGIAQTQRVTIVR